MADDGVGEGPPAPGSEKPPGWYRSGGPNEQAYWDGNSWTARRQWNGGMWVDVPMTGDAAGAGAAAGVQSRPRVAAASPGTPVGKRALLVVGSLIVLAAIGVVVFFLTRGSTPAPTSQAAATSSTTTSTSLPVTVQQGSAAEVASCEADAKSVIVAVTAFQAMRGAYPVPASRWSAATYASNYVPLTSTADGGPLLPTAPSTTSYVVQYDSYGHVWVAPPGSYGPYNPGQDFGVHPDICDAAVG